ncbi:hypothetical protein ThrDRAFT_01266 [Frankia casuarinae]|uniref:Uncharacterized protein n=2 Tax=Frankiaceae TaxID=74712 RepID=Q2J4S2_FRACC|nr:hypothetical protein Francci3_4374 [Frankia casuarinae]EYT93080.1 hypothetical protein ThrDRAFT_01266 [Frankia casuarinae]
MATKTDTPPRARPQPHREDTDTSAPERDQRQPAAPTGPERSSGTRTFTVRAPLLTSRFEVGRGTSMQWPSLGKSAYYLGLGGLAAASIIEWPVAAAIAAGTYVAQHTRPGAPTPSSPEEAEAPERAEPTHAGA